MTLIELIVLMSICAGAGAGGAVGAKHGIFAMIAGSLLGGAVGFALVQLAMMILLRVLGIGNRTPKK